MSTVVAGGIRSGARERKAMNLLIVSQYFWPENFRINEIATSLQDRGIAVTVLTGMPNYPKGAFFPGYGGMAPRIENWRGIGIHRVPVFARGTRAARLALNYVSFVLSGLVWGPWLVRKKRFDVVFVYAPSPILQTIPALFLARLKRCPTLLWVQDLWPESLSATGHVTSRSIIKLVEHVVRFIYRRCDLLLVQSKAFEPAVRALAPTTPVLYHPNSVDDRFARPSPVAAPEVEGWSAGFSVVFAGNVGTAQAVEVIVEAASLLRAHADIRFVVLGEGSRWSWMRDEAERRGLCNLILAGSFPLEVMPAFMRKADCLLVTLADREVFRVTIPSKIQAYLAAGRPILACLEGEGARIVTEAGAGLSVRAEDGVALAEAVLTLSAMPQDERDAMGRRGQAYYSTHFEHEMLVDRLAGILETARTPERPEA